MRSVFYILAVLFAVSPAMANEQDARWADWLKRVEARATLHRDFETRLSALRAERRRLQLAANGNRLFDLQGEHGADYTRQVYENVIAQAKLMMERARALDQPL